MKYKDLSVEAEGENIHISFTISKEKACIKLMEIWEKMQTEYTRFPCAGCDNICEDCIMFLFVKGIYSSDNERKGDE